MNREFAEHFAKNWLDAWNAHDLPRILAHYTDDFEMFSPIIIQVTGNPEGRLQGKQAVGAYWAKALTLFPNLRFEPPLHTDWGQQRCHSLRGRDRQTCGRGLPF